MSDEIERRLTAAGSGDIERKAVACLLRLRGEGRSVEEIAAAATAETGLSLTPAEVDRVLRHVAGPAADDRGADPAYFSGTMGGG